MRARVDDEYEQRSYRVYVTDALKLNGENKYPTERWIDLLERAQNPDTRSGDEVALDVIKRIGLVLKDGGK